jgi:hypothetical protein
MGGYPSARWMVTFSGKRRLKPGPFLRIAFSLEFRNRLLVDVHCINPEHLLPIVHDRGTAYATWFSQNWRRDCDDCGYCKKRFKTPGPYILQLDGRKRGICHQNWLGYRNPTEAQVESLLKMVELHTAAGMV